MAARPATPAAGEKALKLIAREQQGEYLRVGISGGGCNGLSYRMKFVPTSKKGDILVHSAGVDVLVDSARTTSPPPWGVVFAAQSCDQLCGAGAGELRSSWGDTPSAGFGMQPLRGKDKNFVTEEISTEVVYKIEG